MQLDTAETMLVNSVKELVSDKVIDLELVTRDDVEQIISDHVDQLIEERLDDLLSNRVTITMQLD